MAFGLAGGLPAIAQDPAAEKAAASKTPTTSTPEDSGAQTSEDSTAEQKPLRVPLTEVIGTAPEAMEHIPGSGRVITRERLEENRRLTIHEALREVPGVHARDEEGIGIRPNIGIRGLDPVRSRKVHIMEDGVPIMLMPYGDPSAYYFPPVFRFDRIEVLKGSGQLLYGPQNIGGVMNLITRNPPAKPEGNFQFWGGNLNYLNTQFDYGGTWGKSGYLVSYNHYQIDSPRFTHQRMKVDDITFKTVQELSDRTQIMAKFNYYRESSDIGYQGLTQSEWDTRGGERQTPFDREHFDFRRMGYHVAVNHMFTANLTSTTNFFGHYISRPWTRSVKAQTPANADGCTLPAFNPSNAICSTATGAVPGVGQFTNDREYWVYGVEPRFHYNHRLLGIKAEADFGARYMYEESDRIQFRNYQFAGPHRSCFSPGRPDCLGESNLRTTHAYALFFQERLIFGQFTITPGFRLEHITYSQINRLQDVPGTGILATASFTKALPGVGITYSPVKDHTIFFGAHQGMAPPQVGDAITLADAAVVDLGPELSWTYELGTRGNLAPWAGYEFTLYQMDFSNQIITQSAAGGVGATLTSAGATRHRGIELAGRLDLLDAATGVNKNQDIILDLNYTWVAQAEFAETRASSLGCLSLTPAERAAERCASPQPPGPWLPTNPMSVTGNRLPYSPEHLLTAGIGYADRALAIGAFNARLEAQCISDQFGDDRNTVIPTPNGQRGIVRGWCMLNAAVNQHVKKINTTFFLTGKNMLDQLVMVDRARGIYPGLPALWQAGARWTF
jgi:Fe(3+) dicitrate transport protein